MKARSRSRLRRSRLASPVAVVTGISMVITLLGNVPAAAAVAFAWTTAAPAERSVPGTDAGARPLPKDPAEAKAVRSSPTVSWPAPGRAVVDLTAPPARATDGAGATTTRARAGALPVYVGSVAPAAPGVGAAVGGFAAGVGTSGAARAGADPAVPSRVEVNLLGRHDDGLLLRIKRADGVNRAGRISVEVDYSGFRDAFGGDWATRLRLVRLPECAAVTPAAPECRGTAVATRNNGSGRLTGELPVGGAESGLFAVAAAAGGPAGDFGQSTLSPSATWQVGGPSGDFSWQYPMDVPPSLGGPAPELALAYSSGSVDGRTSGTNNQPSWVGEGFSFAPGGYVERRYVSCASDRKNGANNKNETGDLCWGTDNITLVLNGRGGELLYNSETQRWHLRSDDGSRVERHHDTSLGNGDKDGEYWVVTTRDGTQYHFGRNKLPGWSDDTHAQTNSAWTVPVFGNHAGEPCHKSTFDASHCDQAWRWNLDYVVDPHGNTASYFYTQEKNYYARNVTATKVSQYVRGGYLRSIQYGQRADAIYTSPWVGRVEFEAADRCIPNTTCTKSAPANWPDVPWDQDCASSTNCNNKFYPTFWTQKRLKKVTTQVWAGTGARDVDSWTLTHSYPNPDDGTKARLFLDSIQHSGLVNGRHDLPPVTFQGKQLTNRVDGNDNIPAMNWWRIETIRSEGGGEITVSYSPRDCSYQALPQPATNTKRCHPVRWTPEGLSERTDWFNKYVVTRVVESDRTTGLTQEISDVEYVGAPAWRHDEEDGLVPEDRKTWSQWRGYERVRVRKGVSGQVRSLTELVYFRGMDGDKTATEGVTKRVDVVDSTNTAWRDTDQFAGMLRESITYSADGSSILSRSITDPWLSPATVTRVRSWGTTTAHNVQQKRLVQGEVSGGRWRETATLHTYDSGGTLLTEQHQGDLARSDDDTCTQYTYARNSAAWLLETVVRKRTTVGGCDREPTGIADVVSDERFYYDGSDTLGATPTRGAVTRREEISGWSGGAPTYLTTMEASYDPHGRLEEKTDVLGARERTTYTPATGPTTRVTSTNQLGHTTSTELEPAWGAEVSVTAPNGARNVAEYDALGRVVKTWLAGRVPGRDSPSATYEYTTRVDGPNVVTVRTLEANGDYRTEYQLLDGKMRLRQTQAPSPRGGRVITDVSYDVRGLKVRESGPYYNDAPPGTTLFLPDEALLPAQTVTVYDGANRPTEEIFLSYGVEKWRTSHVHEVDRQHTTPPAGQTPTTRILDAEGRLVELRQYRGSTPSGEYDATKYTYNRRGQPETIVDSAGNVWRFGYDARGRRIRTEDPDQGVTTYTYNDRNDIVSETDAREVTLWYEYDALGRKTALRQGSATGAKLAEWGYDRLPDGTPAPGLQTSATRYVDGAAYTTAITGYDAANRVTARTVTVPAREGALAGTYTFRNTYRPDGEVETATLPGGGGLAQETLRYGYNALGMPTTLAGATSYVTDTAFSVYGDVEELTLSAGDRSVRRSFRYEAGTRRLSLAETRREVGPQLISSVAYRYDPGGNVIRMVDTPDPATGVAADTQCFRHDHLRRLTEAWTPASGDCAAAPTAAGLGGPAPYWHSWTLDKLGNRLSETRTAPNGSRSTSSYAYNPAGEAQPHALRSVTSTGPDGTKKVDEYAYDAAGNLTSRVRAGVGQTLEWDAEGRLAKVTENGRVTSYVYDAAGDRLIRRDPTGTTLYLGETQLRMDTSGAVSGLRYYTHGDRAVAMRNGKTGKVTWLVSDHHGTAELAVDESSQSVTRQRRDPYGGTRGSGDPNLAGDRGFVGGTNDPSTGLTHLGAREYDPATGRFVSVDPEISYDDPQHLNGYAYANNSPVSFTDPDGRAYVTKRVTAYKTVYRTVIKRVTRLVRVLVTMYVFMLVLTLLGFLLPQLTPILVAVTKVIVRYIKVLEKRLVKYTKLIRIWIKDPKRENKTQLRAFSNMLDEMWRKLDHFRRTAQMATRLAGQLLVRALWHGGLMTAQGLLGFKARFGKPLNFLTNRFESYGIGKLVEWGTELTGGQCSMQHGMRVCWGGSLPYGGIGTAYGDTFLSKNSRPDEDLMQHEKVHRRQWRRYGAAFGPMYLLEALRTGGDPCRNTYENNANLAKGNYDHC
ncbi:RHS repeat-associated core domain-containing protein [Plantactinospora sp. B6F1]|uniref:RHS repeat domain-containing protein n=1 Tax=Plantactinospora sp. B6F1 TaxID=3158971 RepID=UPI0032D9435D